MGLVGNEMKTDKPSAEPKDYLARMRRWRVYEPALWDEVHGIVVNLRIVKELPSNIEIR